MRFPCRVASSARNKSPCSRHANRQNLSRAPRPLFFLRVYPFATSPATAKPSLYHSVRAHPSGVFYSEIRSGPWRLGLGTFDTAHEAARAYDAAAWRLGRPRREMNFIDVSTREQA